MAEDKLIKSGQLTVPRLIFLAVSGGLIIFFVARGGIWLSVGYFALTLALCVLLFLIAIDYGVKMDKVSFGAQPSEGPAIQPAASEVFKPTVTEPRPKRKPSRAPKRRR